MQSVYSENCSLNSFSNLIDLRLFFEGMTDYVIIKLPEYFPNYYDYDDIDIICTDLDHCSTHIISAGQIYVDQGFEIKVTKVNKHVHIDFYPPNKSKLNFRFDLISSLDVYRKVKVNPLYHRIVLTSKQQIVQNFSAVFVPTLEHELVLRLLEYLEWRDEIPSKVKHLNYIVEKNSRSFFQIVNQYTNLLISEGEHLQTGITIGYKSVSDKSGLEDNSSFYYQLSPTCQIPDLAKIYEDFFGRRTDGCFVEFGAFDGEYVSNTSGLADIGWRGHYIEPVPEYYESCKLRHSKNSNVMVHNGAIGSESRIVTINVGGPLSTISDEMKDHFGTLDWAKNLFCNSNKVDVQQITLSDFLEANHISPNFELLVVDVEGMEWDVFRNFDIDYWQPKMVIIELHDQNDDYLLIRDQCIQLVEYFNNHEYVPLYKDGTNTIYVKGAVKEHKKHRMDYFMIWGHGIQYTNQIMDILRNDIDIEIITIVRKMATNIVQFIQDVYACDTVPFEHLRDKTNYLLTVDPKIVFILVKNLNAHEEYFGEGAFRHIQCRHIKNIKEEIRNNFNPRIDGKRTEDHVIHASDYESQVEHVLKVLGLPPLESYIREPNSELDVPYHLGSFEHYEVRQVAIDELLANILERGLTPLVETPHYQYIVGNKEIYKKYHGKYCGSELTDDHFPEAFDLMINNFKYDFTKTDGKRSLILAKPLAYGRYQILDGVHRACILKAHGTESVTVAIPLHGKYFLEQSTLINIVIFSKDRAMQLDALLNSWSIHSEDKDIYTSIVIFKASDAKNRQQYLCLKMAYPNVRFVEEVDFKLETIEACQGSQYTIFLVDDAVFIKPFSLGSVINKFQTYPDIIGFSFRLGKNTDYCYMRNKDQKVPEFSAIGDGVLKYNWTLAEYDFGYPLEVSSSMYRTNEILPLIKNLNFRNPNTLELELAQQAQQYSEANKYLMCFEDSVAFCNPINMVQSVFINNRVAYNSSYSSEELAELFAKGSRIDITKWFNFAPNSCHQEMPLSFIVKESKTDAIPPAVTIIIPCYNSISLLIDCLDSVIKQSISNWEVIVIDDCSDDGDVSALVSSYNDERMSVKRHFKNKGLGAARNTGFCHARASLVLPLDADDMIATDYLAKTLQLIESDLKIDCVFTHFQLFGVSQDVWRWRVRNMPDMAQEQWLPGPGTLQRRSLWERVGGYCEDNELRVGNEDWDYWLTAAEKGFNSICIPEPLYLYRRQSTSMSTNLAYEDFKTRIHIYNRRKKFFDSIQKGDDFVGSGFIKSAKTSWLRKERTRSALLAAEAWWLTAGKKGLELDNGSYHAIESVVTLLEQNPEDEDIWYFFGKQTVSLHKNRSAGLSSLQALFPEPVPLAALRFKLGELLTFDRNEVLEMIYVFQRKQLLSLLEQNPLSIAIWLELARLSDQHGDASSAKAAYEGALALDPEQIETLNYLIKNNVYVR